jgi:uncharacterized protein (DUF1778 family)
MTTTARQSEKNISRIDLRLPSAAKKTIEQAAALEKAERIITEKTLIQLAIQDQQMLAQALSEPVSEPATSFLEALADEYRLRVSGA